MNWHISSLTLWTKLHMGLSVCIFNVISFSLPVSQLFLISCSRFLSLFLSTFPLWFFSCCFLLTRPHTVNRGYCISQTQHCSISLHSRHGGHPAAPSLACRFQSERRGPFWAGWQLPLPWHEAFVHIRLHPHLLHIHPLLPVSSTCIFHLFHWCGLWPQSTAEWRTPD